MKIPNTTKWRGGNSLPNKYRLSAIPRTRSQYKPRLLGLDILWVLCHHQDFIPSKCDMNHLARNWYKRAKQILILSYQTNKINSEHKNVKINLEGRATFPVK